MSSAPVGGKLDKIYSSEGLYDSHRLVLSHVTPGTRVLELGPGAGHVTRFLSELGCHVTCIEVSPGAAELAAPFTHKMVVGNLDDPHTWLQLDDGAFDAIIAGDVLEHLLHPEEVLGRSRRLLSSTGRVIVSVPNIAHWSIRLSLGRGRFDYTDFGILDEQHVRFFTIATLVDLAKKNGFSVATIALARGGFPADKLFQHRGLRHMKGMINKRLLARRPALFGYQIITTLVPADR